LKPSESIRGTLRFSKSGALVGSSYPISVLASGIAAGVRFASHGALSVRVVQGRMDARKGMMLAFLALSACVLGQWAFSWYRARKAVPA
jgi:hypothetical protein